MRTIYIKPDIVSVNRETQFIQLGRKWCCVDKVIFDLSELIADFGDGTAKAFYKRHPSVEHYEIPLKRNGTQAIWVPTEKDTAIPGVGELELVWNAEDARSITGFKTVVKSPQHFCGKK